MASFDFVESASKGYSFFWRARLTILRLAVLPLFIKCLSFISLTALEMNENLLRQGLFLIPSYFAEGWLVIVLIRLAVLGEYKVPVLTGDAQEDSARIQDRSRLILAGTVVYVLTKMMLSFFMALFLEQKELYGPQQAPAQGMGSFIAATIILAILVWAFRFLWLYIPVALGRSIERFLDRIKPFMTSVYMLAVWILCFVPLALIFIVASQAATTVFPGTQDQISTPALYFIMCIQAFVELSVAAISSVSLAYGIQSLYDNTNTKTDIF